MAAKLGSTETSPPTTRADVVSARIDGKTPINGRGDILWPRRSTVRRIQAREDIDCGSEQRACRIAEVCLEAD